MKKAKIFSLIATLALGLSFFSSPVHAQSTINWGVSLNPASIWTNSGYSDYKDPNGYKNTGFISCGTIQDANSYYIRARAVNSPQGEPRTNSILVQQRSKSNITGDIMTNGYTYYLQAKNDYMESQYTWTSGQFNWD